MEVKWTLGHTIGQAHEVQPLLKALRELVEHWESSLAKIESRWVA